MNRKEVETCNLLKKYSEEFNIPVDEIVVGIISRSLHVWHYDEGRARHEVFKTLKIVPLAT